MTRINPRINPPSRLSKGKVVLLLLTGLPGVAGIVIFTWLALQDSAQLQRDYGYFTALIEQSSTIEALFVAEAQQNIYRLNLMRDGIFVFLSSILLAIGLHGATRRY
ncbi:MAG: hypothetical protein AAF171_16935 [Cyanobacteria bacterium P01_A01_bin.116]